MTFQRGDYVRVTADGRTVRAFVALASTNGRSLVLLFEAMLGSYVGTLPVLQEPDGSWIAILDGMPVTIEAEPSHEVRH